MSEKIKLIKPDITFDEVESEMRDVFASGQLTKGINVAKFRESLSDYTGAKYSFLTTSATTALSLCLKAIGIQAKDKVAISDFSFPATANVVEDLGAIPIFIDVELDTFNMSTSELSKILGDVKAVIFVDAFGNPSGLHDIVQICREQGVPIIEDAACALGSSCTDQKIGNIADLTCFSFHPRKLLTTGEGGAITTNNTTYADFLEIKLNHGAKGKKGLGLDFIDFGYNYRMSEIQALLGWKQIEKLDKLIQARQEIFKEYTKHLTPLGFCGQKVDANCAHNVQSVVFTVPAGTNRNQLVHDLVERAIETTLGTYCLSGTSYYRKKYDLMQKNAMSLEQDTITLPCFEGVDVEFITKTICEILRDARL